MKKIKKRIGKIFILVCMFVTFFSMGVSPTNVMAAPEEAINHASTSIVTVNRAPVAYWGPDKLIDGIVNRTAAKAEQSRWSSESGAPAWVQFDLKEKKRFDTFTFAWETEGQNAQDYHLEKSDDGTTWTTFYTAPTMSEGHPIDEVITLDAPQEARYVRLTIDKLKPGAFNSVSLYEVGILETIQNVSLGATATSKSNEAPTLDAAKAIDGKTDTRWASYNTKPTWLALDYGETKAINSMIIHWERMNATNYEIQTSTDGNTWTTIEGQAYTDKPIAYQQKINFKETVNTQYIRVLINDFDPVGAPENENSVSWQSVSIIELETYATALYIPKPTPKQIADDLTLIPVGASDTSFVIPTVPEGYTISFIGADYEQIVTRDLQIIRPLTDRTVIVNFEVTDTETGVKATSKDYPVLIEGLYDEATSQNSKPTVVPELQEWYGLTGEFTIQDTSRIVISNDMFMNAAIEMQKDYEDITGKPIEIVTDSPVAGDFYFVENVALEEETYEMEVSDYVTVSASTNTGTYWATRSILQIIKQTGTTIPQGYVKDYPKYEIRGFMLDVARKPLTMDFVYEVSKQMSWYKLNDFQLHLNDNHIQSPSSYIGFRLESDIENLANKDLAYTKEEFNQFMKDSKNIGVNVVPEFDTPGHAAAITRARPDLARGDEIEYLDVTNPAALAFVEDIIDEYVDGEDPVFIEGSVLHVGTDEYKRGNKEAFRQYQNDILEYVRDEKGITPRVWGSQTENSGTTPITVEDVQMNIWNNGYSNPKTMYDLGYDLINTRDSDLYIVPGAGYYSDYINQTKIATTWQPNNIGGTIIPAGDEQMLGATFAVWNDMNSNPAPEHSLRDNGFTELEIFDRIFAITPTFGAKLWGDIKDYTPGDINTIVETTKYAPNSNPTHEVESKTSIVVDYSFDTSAGTDFSGNAYDLENQKNVSYEAGNASNALTLKGGESYVETPLTDIGINTTLDFWVKKDAGSSSEEQILFESEFGAIKAVQKETGQFGYSTDFRDHSFNYTLPDDTWVHITIKTYYGSTELYVDDVLVDTLAPITYRETLKINYSSLITPIERIGSTTNAFKGQIDDFTITKGIVSDNRIPHINMTAQVDSAEPGGEGKLAIDDNPSSIWHTKWDSSDPLPQSITLTFDQEYMVNKLTYLPRPTGSNGNITKYIVSVSTDGTTYKEVGTGTWANDGSLKTAEFDPVNAKYVRLTAVEAIGGFASAAEINIYRLQEEINTEDLEALIAKADALDDTKYTADSVSALEFVLRDAKRALTTALLQAEIDEAVIELQTALDDLEEIIILDKSDLLTIIEKAEEIDTSEYTEESVTPFNEALEEAKEALDSATTQQELDDAYNTLDEAINNLLEKEEALTYQTLTDDSGNVTASGYFHENVTLVVNKYGDPNDLINTIKDKTLLDNNNFHDGYDIYLLKDGVAYEPMGMVSVEITVDDTIIDKNPKVIYIDPNGEVETLLTTTGTNTVQFNTNHFSNYGIISSKVAEAPVTPNPGNNADTGDTTNINAIIALGAISLLVGYLVLRSKKKEL